jgi:hypothetical protein
MTGVLTQRSAGLVQGRSGHLQSGDKRQAPSPGAAGMMRGFLQLAEFVQAVSVSSALLFQSTT